MQARSPATAIAYKSTRLTARLAASTSRPAVRQTDRRNQVSPAAANTLAASALGSGR